MTWTIVAADLAGTEVGELRQAADWTITPRPRLRVPTLQLKVRGDNILKPYLLAGETTLLKAYDPAGVLRFNGPLNPSIEQIREDASGSIAVIAAGGAIRLADRLVGKSRAGFVQGTALAPVADSAIAAAVLAAVNADGPTGIVAGSMTGAAARFVGPWYLKSGLEAINELAAPLDGFDWEVVPLEPASNAGAIGQLVTAPAFGQDRPNAVWEFGTGRRNVKSWRRAIQTDKVANRVWNMPPGWPDNQTQDLVSSSDAESIASRGLHEDVATADLAVDAFRQQLVAEHVQVRRRPRHVITFEPTPEAAGGLVYRTDYEESDLVRFHAVEQTPIFDSSGVALLGYEETDEIDIIARIYSVAFTRDDTGKYTPAITIVDE